MSGAAEGGEVQSSGGLKFQFRAPEEVEMLDDLNTEDGELPRTPTENNMSSTEKVLHYLKTVLECPICLDTIRATPALNCVNGHVLCNRCVARLLNRAKCPICKENTTWNKSLIAAKLIEIVPHNCKFEDKGCKFKGRLEDGSLEAHERKCQFRIVECPKMDCDEKLVFCNLMEHVAWSDRCFLKPIFDEYKISYPINKANGNIKSSGTYPVKRLKFNERDFFFTSCVDNDENFYCYVLLAGTPEESKAYTACLDINIEGNRESGIQFRGRVGSIDEVPKKSKRWRRQPFVFRCCLRNMMEPIPRGVEAFVVNIRCNVTS